VPDVLWVVTAKAAVPHARANPEKYKSVKVAIKME
jgi:hypothetical protein